MEKNEFEIVVKRVLEKLGNALDMDLTWCFVSTDPDALADFGCDIDGNLVINGISFPMQIKDIDSIRFKPYPDDFRGYVRFESNDDFYIECLFTDCDFGEEFNIKYLEHISTLKKSVARVTLNDWMKQ